MKVVKKNKVRIFSGSYEKHAKDVNRRYKLKYFTFACFDMMNNFFL